jgi:carboxylesterase type B
MKLTQEAGYVDNSNANYDGAEVVEKSGGNIVMVNFNYRVGIWGFLASERLRQDGDLNVGLLDQRMLLRWVKKYISKVRKYCATMLADPC